LLTWQLSLIPNPSSSPNLLSQNFAPALIMLRVVLGRARPDTEWSRKISGLQFNCSSGVEEIAISGDATSTILTVPRSDHGEISVSNGESRTVECLDGKEGMGRMNEGMARV
jgi:hypothetical protein